MGAPPRRPVGAVMRRPRIAAAVWYVLGALYFLVPLVAMFVFSLKLKKKELGFQAYLNVFADHKFIDSFVFSFEMAVLAVIAGLVLVLPTLLWVYLRAPKWKVVLDLFSLLPFVVPPVILAFGYLRLYSSGLLNWAGSPLLLVAGYVVLCYPFVYRSLDSGLRALDLKGLWEASSSLGAGPLRTLFRVVLPNLRSSVLAAVFLTLATVMGELTLAILLAWPAFGPYMALVGRDLAYEPAALAVLSFALTWGALGLIHLFSRGDHGVSRTQPTP
jgi:putative spermidine/putrescine transport system permease protein